MDDGLLSRNWLRHAALAAAVAVGLLAAPASASALSATTKAPTQVTQTTATLQGYVEPSLLFSSYWYFELGATSAYGIQSQLVPFYSSGTVKALASGLEPGTTYHYRVVVKRSGTTLRGADQAFTTAAANVTPPPDPDPASDPAPTSTSDGTLGDPLGGLAPGTVPGTSPPVTTNTGPATVPVGTGTGTSTGPRPGTGTGADTSTDPTGTDDEPAGTLAGEGARPVLGTTVGAAPGNGSILVRKPGENRFEPLEDGGAIPVGSTVDSRNGSVNVVTAVGDDGDTQTATFRGAVFKVRQSQRGGGLTHIALRGGNFAACAARGRTSVSAARSRRHRHRPVRRLWGRDHHGRFRTHGRGAIATVRGTTWTMADYCHGTRTRVVHGAVSVRDRARHRSVLVRAGHSYFARTR